MTRNMADPGKRSHHKRTPAPRGDGAPEGLAGEVGAERAKAAAADAGPAAPGEEPRPKRRRRARKEADAGAREAFETLLKTALGLPFALMARGTGDARWNLTEEEATTYATAARLSTKAVPEEKIEEYAKQVLLYGLAASVGVRAWLWWGDRAKAKRTERAAEREAEVAAMQRDAEARAAGMTATVK